MTNVALREELFKVICETYEDCKHGNCGYICKRCKVVRRDMRRAMTVLYQEDKKSS